jgi:hypothetical protein
MPSPYIPTQEKPTMKTTKKLGFAAAIVVAMFIGFAAPAAATDRPIKVTSGTLDTFLGSFDLAPGSQGTPPCPEKVSTLKLTTSANGTWSTLGSYAGQFQFPAGSGTWYQADFTMLAGSGGTWSGAGPVHPVTGTLGIQVRITRIGSASSPNCAKTDLRCIITGLFAVTGTYSGASPLPTTTTNDTILFNGNTVTPLTTSSCTIPWIFVGGTNATLNNVTMTVQ